MRFLCLALLFVLPSSLPAALAITGNTTVNRDQMVRLTVSGRMAGAAVIWDISPEDSVDADESSDRVVFVAPPGTYRVKCRAISTANGKTTIETATVSVTVKDTAPSPARGQPKPPQAPPIETQPVRKAPSPDVVWAIIVTAKPSWVRTMLDDTSLWTTIGSYGIGWRVLSPDDPLVTSKGYSKLIKREQISGSALLLQTKKGTWKVQTLPRSRGGLLEAMGLQ